MECFTLVPGPPSRAPGRNHHDTLLVSPYGRTGLVAVVIGGWIGLYGWRRGHGFCVSSWVGGLCGRGGVLDVWVWAWVDLWVWAWVDLWVWAWVDCVGRVVC